MAKRKRSSSTPKKSQSSTDKLKKSDNIVSIEKMKVRLSDKNSSYVNGAISVKGDGISIVPKNKETIKAIKDGILIYVGKVDTFKGKSTDSL